MSTYHVYPVQDLIQHEADTDEPTCACGPRTEPVKAYDGSMHWMIIHSSLDGRERNE